jgi:hypothetical protein
VKSTKAFRSRARLRRWKRARSSRSARSASSITSAPAETRCGTLSCETSNASVVQPFAVLAQIDAKWLFPLPRGPCRRSTVSGHSGQLSMTA